jgi:2-dehydro-3-deoxyphosphooctonate aldolase (KDO 8-P synthase)
MKKIKIGDISFGGDAPLLLIAGPCVIESDEIILETAGTLKRICEDLKIPLVFKSSYDKANRTSLNSFRGPGIDRGLRTLVDIKSKYNLPVISDVHSKEEIKPAAEVLDALQIPALLSRQTDLILAAAQSGKPVNVKKGQFLAPWDIKNIIEKFVSTGNDKIFITERGTTFGYNNLVVDFRGLPIMRSFGYPVVFDVTHSLQIPGGRGTSSGGQAEFAGPFARAAAAVGVDGLFMEVHPEPEKALCDGQNMISLDFLSDLLKQVKAIDSAL